jgi:hypothetical protein
MAKVNFMLDNIFIKGNLNKDFNKDRDMKRLENNSIKENFIKGSDMETVFYILNVGTSILVSLRMVLCIFFYIYRNGNGEMKIVNKKSLIGLW